MPHTWILFRLKADGPAPPCFRYITPAFITAAILSVRRMSWLGSLRKIVRSATAGFHGAIIPVDADGAGGGLNRFERRQSALFHQQPQLAMDVRHRIVRRVAEVVRAGHQRDAELVRASAYGHGPEPDRVAFAVLARIGDK